MFLYFTLNENIDKQVFYNLALNKFSAYIHKELALKYYDNGLPYADDYCVSITNTEHFQAIAFSKNRIGIDAEYFSRKVSNEFAKRINNENKSVIESFCEKESYFKLFGNGSLIKLLNKSNELLLSGNLLQQEYVFKQLNFLQDLCFVCCLPKCEEIVLSEIFYEN